MKIIILDFSTATVHIYDYPDDTENTEDFLKEKGHRESHCQWLITGTPTITIH